MVDKVEQLKTSGNEAIKESRFDDAIAAYSEAIELAPDNHVLYSNRSAAYVKAGKYDEAVKDAEKTIELKHDWGKGYSRLGTAYRYLKQYQDAESAYQKGLKYDPHNETLQQGLKESRQLKSDEMNPFKQPDAMAKLRSDPKTAAYFSDPSFVQGLEVIANDSTALTRYINDSRYVTALGVLLGVDLQTMATSGADDPLTQKPPTTSKPTPMPPQPKKDPPKKQQKQDSKPKSSKDEALREKDAGNSAYKNKDFVAALAHYNRAIELDPENITFLTNKAAVFFEQGEYDKCLETCELAVDKGREVGADFKQIAKAYTRMGNVYAKQEKWTHAIKYFDKSLAEHRDPEILKKKQQAQKALKEEERKAYIDPTKSLEAKQKGNELYQKGKFGEAIQHYNEAIKRNPDDAKLYSNRAACYQKLMEPQLALKDCDECIRLDPDFVKGHIRKGHALFAMKQNSKAMASFQRALELDPNSRDATEGLNKCYSSDDPEERRKMAMSNPEIQSIMSDPAMQMILKQMQENPGAINDHLKNPEIASKIQQLIDAGIISFRPQYI